MSLGVLSRYMVQLMEKATQLGYVKRNERSPGGLADVWKGRRVQLPTNPKDRMQRDRAHLSEEQCSCLIAIA
jgi:hypothetical protein